MLPQDMSAHRLLVRRRQMVRWRIGIAHLLADHTAALMPSA
jgi:hypothetical protein